MRILPQLQHQILCLCVVNQSFPGILIKEKSEEIVESLLCLINGTIDTGLVSLEFTLYKHIVTANIVMINRLGQNLILVAYRSKKATNNKQTTTLNNEWKFIALNIQKLKSQCALISNLRYPFYTTCFGFFNYLTQ